MAWALLASPRFLSYRVVGGGHPPPNRVAGDGHPPPAPSERSVPISGTTLFEAWFTALRALGTPNGRMPNVVAVTAIGL